MGTSFTYIVTIEQEDDDGPVISAGGIQETLLDSGNVQDASGVSIAVSVAPFHAKLLTSTREADDGRALDEINEILSAPEWSVGMLEDICEIVRATGREEVADPPEYLAH